jgi:hypothetical protein
MPKNLSSDFEKGVRLKYVVGDETGVLTGLGIYDGFDLVPGEAIYPTYRDLAEFFGVPLVEAFSIG